mgnify:CR=1 FL=1
MNYFLFGLFLVSYCSYLVFSSAKSSVNDKLHKRIKLFLFIIFAVCALAFIADIGYKALYYINQ